MSRKRGGWPADRDERIARDGFCRGLPNVKCEPDDPERLIWTGKRGHEVLDGFVWRCEDHPDVEVFLANVSGIMDPDAEEPEEGFNAGNEPDSVCFQVTKDGVNTNRFDDGTVGVPKWAHEFFDYEPSDVHCSRCGEYARLWDVRRNEWSTHKL
jgi:hypothetical protein